MTGVWLSMFRELRGGDLWNFEFPLWAFTVDFCFSSSRVQKLLLDFAYDLGGFD